MRHFELNNSVHTETRLRVVKEGDTVQFLQGINAILVHKQ
jgi:hypothetical protein